MKQNTIRRPKKEMGEGREQGSKDTPKGGDKWEWQTINVIGQIMLHKLSNAKRHYQKGAPQKVGRDSNAKRASEEQTLRAVNNCNLLAEGY